MCVYICVCVCVYIYTTEPLCSIPKINTTLYIN